MPRTPSRSSIERTGPSPATRSAPAVEPQPVVGDLAHRQPPGGRRRHGDREIRLALGQREHPRQRHHLHLQLGIVAAQRVAGVDQQVVRDPVRRADPHRARQPVGLAADLLDRRGRDALHRLRVLEQAAPGLGQRVALGRAVEQPRAERFLERGDPPARPSPGRARGCARPPAAARRRATARNTRRSSHFIALFCMATLLAQPAPSCKFALRPDSKNRLRRRPNLPLRCRAKRTRGNAMQELAHFIDGKRVAGTLRAASPTSSTPPPARSRPACRWPRAAELDAAVAGAARAQVTWARDQPAAPRAGDDEVRRAAQPRHGQARRGALARARQDPARRQGRRASAASRSPSSASARRTC